MIYRSNVFIDRCSATLPVERSLWNIVTDNFFGAANLDQRLTQVRGGNESAKFQLYHFSWNLFAATAMSEDLLCVIQAYPRLPSTSFMRIDWNPSKAGLAGTREIISFLGKCVPNFAEVWEQSLITRVDVTFDVFNIHLSQILAFTQSSKTKHIAYDHGFYLGVPKSERRLLIYDKAFQESKQQAKTRKLSRTPGAHRQQLKTRIEFRFIRIGKIREIRSLENGLLRYSIVLKYKTLRIKGNNLWSRFLDNCYRIGAQNALALIPNQTQRRNYRKFLDEYCTPRWYDKRKIWAEAIQALERTLTIP